MKLFKSKSPIVDSERYRLDKKAKYIRNIQRLKGYFETGNLKGITLQVNYLENEGIRLPRNLQDCDRLIQEITDVE